MTEPLAEKVVQPAINSAHVAYCPTMDLVALATIDEQVQVYRLNGQKVFGIVSKQTSGQIDQLKWKPNGIAALNPLPTIPFGANSVSLKDNHLQPHIAIIH